MRVESGVPQGCPASGALYALAAFPIIAVLPPRNVYVYADDTAILVESVDRRPAIFAALEAVAKATGLQINLTKCVVVPLRADGLRWEDNCHRYREVTRTRALMRADVEIRHSARYLGVVVGPESARV